MGHQTINPTEYHFTEFENDDLKTVAHDNIILSRLLKFFKTTKNKNCFRAAVFEAINSRLKGRSKTPTNNDSMVIDSMQAINLKLPLDASHVSSLSSSLITNEQDK